MSRPPEVASSWSSAEYTPEERALLLRLAHESISSRFEGREISLEPPSGHLAEPRGAFTTIYYLGELRGCVGYVAPVASVYRTVADTARAAAFDDTRFPPVRAEELPDLQVSLSILSATEPIQAEQVEIGRHGLVISSEGRRGLVLPQLTVERNWGRQTFLAQTCRKAGLPEDAWRRGAKIEAFTAEIFTDLGLER
jgi:AmmeMemoRadiSam system protein A